jgi:hypothetical protein
MVVGETLKIFSHQKIPILAKVVTLNLLLLSTSYVSYEYYLDDLLNPDSQIPENKYMPFLDSPSRTSKLHSFIDDGSTVFFAMAKRNKTLYQTVYSLGSYHEDEIRVIDVMGMSSQDPWYIHNVDSTWNPGSTGQTERFVAGHDFYITDQDDKIGIWIKESVWIVYTQGNETAPFGFWWWEDFGIDINYNYYFLEFAKNDITTTGEGNLEPQTIVQMDIDRNINIVNIKSQDGSHYFLYHDQVTGSYHLAVVPNINAAISGSLDDETWKDIASQEDLLVVERNLTNSLSYFSSYKLPTVNLENEILEYHSSTSLTQLPEIQLVDPTLEIIDSKGRVHFLGEPDTHLANEVEGNQTGLNQPEYAMYDPSTDNIRHWDLIPNFFAKGTQDWEPYGPMTVREAFNNMIVVSFVAPSINGFYDEEQYWDQSKTFSVVKLDNLLKTSSLQVAVFDPSSPTVDNYIQFNKTLSQTPRHTIEFPRLTSSLILPETAFTQKAESDGGDLSSTLTIYPHLLFTDTHTERIKVYVNLHNKGNGYTVNEWRIGESIDIGFSLVSYDIIQQQNLLDIEAINLIAGPIPNIKLDYDAASNSDSHDYEIYHENFTGVHVGRLYYAFQSENGVIHVLHKGTIYADPDYLTKHGLSSNGYFLMLITKEGEN